MGVDLMQPSLVSPLILTGKQILQELCKNVVEWDDEVPDYVKPKWIKWKDELHKLDQLKMPRCYKPDDFGEVEKVELHHFSDACQEGYVPKLELAAAVVSVRIHKLLKGELEYNNVEKISGNFYRQYNPADHASRGMTADKLCNSKIWWSSPEFLWRQNEMDSHPQYKVINENDPEVKKVVCHADEEGL
ncbi:uncharacterized protein LOC135102217 [Scylla paramamosain]|uniref:uncharacterized protein LOC135102217 n=1 Tax=Scylla paramamosain TaxID=85552 RepID=UPI0030836ECD